MQRPLAVTILALLHWLEAVLLVLLGGLLVVWARLAVDLAGLGFEPPGVPPEMLEVLFRLADPGRVTATLVVLGIIAAVFVAIGVGLWRLRNWARRLTIALMALRLLLLVPGLLFFLVRFDPLGLGVQLLFAGVYAWIVWYLFQPRVKQAFAVPLDSAATGS